MNKEKGSFGLIIIIIIGSILVASVIIGIEVSNSKKIAKEFSKEGYETTSEDIFYKKIVSGNTLDDYYKDIANKKDSYYEEYYFSKESNDFIELKLLYQQDVSTTLNIISNLENGETEFNYELAYKTSHLLIEGNSTNNYECKIIDNNKVDMDTVSGYCDMIMDEINNFNDIKNDLLKNDKIRSLVEKD